ncbi:MAG: hypothetical protein COB30_002670 [Ectothiorhodospiraceae bacterium]|nr:hypothetical protein [Ectothiorhodospiraceae bacterium]
MFCGTLRNIGWLPFSITVAITTTLVPVLLYIGMINPDSLNAFITPQAE